ncbi:MAG: transposase [Algibacter sp.]
MTCEYFNQCIKSKQGRTIRRSVHEAIKEKIVRIYNSEEGQAVYEKRKTRAELQFGHLKRNLGTGAFILRGIDEINTELGILGICFNITRMITISGGVYQLMSILEHIK